MKISHILVILNVIGLVLAILWWYFVRDFEPAITTVGLTAALAGQLFIKEKKKKNIKMTQKSGDNSTNIQVGGDIN
jgi:hypothetical protein